MLFNWRNIIGTVIVLLLAGTLIFLTVTTMQKTPGGSYETFTRAGDWVHEGSGYNYRDLTTILFIGVGDGETTGTTRDVRYLTLLAIDADKGTYSLLHIDPDTQATVDVVNSKGGRVDEPRTARLCEAQKNGGGDFEACASTVRSVKRLLHNVEIDYYVCVLTGSTTPEFTTNPIGALTTLADELNRVNNPTVETDELGMEIEYPYTTLITDLTDVDKVNSYCRVLIISDFEADEAFRGERIGNMFVPDAEQADKILLRLYFEKNN